MGLITGSHSFITFMVREYTRIGVGTCYRVVAGFLYFLCARIGVPNEFKGEGNNTGGAPTKIYIGQGSVLVLVVIRGISVWD
jgi:hypothetical protein